MLNDVDIITKIDKSGMIEVVERFPDQIKETVDLVNSTEIDKIFKIDNIIISGMGGSAISGDVIKSYLRDKFDIPIYINREYDLPKWANKNTLVFSQSYSGNTEETLSAFKHAYQKKCKIIGISSGGKLQEYCEKRKLQHIKIPNGLAPRAAIAYLLFSCLLAMKKIGLLRNDIDLDIEESITLTKEIRDNNKKTIPEEKNLSKQIARKIFNSTPQIYGFGIYAPIAKRWCNQFNENSKIIAGYDVIPESNHNDIVGWSHDNEKSHNYSCILFRDDKIETIYLSKRLEFMKELLSEIVKNVIEIQVKGKKTLAKMLYFMYLGDFITCYLAILKNIDPTPVNAIEELKNQLKKL